MVSAIIAEKDAMGQLQAAKPVKTAPDDRVRETKTLGGRAWCWMTG
jgi:hypothetical protein